MWPTIGAALASKYHWLVIACDACGTIIDLDLTVKRRGPDAPMLVWHGFRRSECVTHLAVLVRAAQKNPQGRKSRGAAYY